MCLLWLISFTTVGTVEHNRKNTKEPFCFLFFVFCLMPYHLSLTPNLNLCDLCAYVVFFYTIKISFLL